MSEKTTEQDQSDKDRPETGPTADPHPGEGAIVTPEALEAAPAAPPAPEAPEAPGAIDSGEGDSGDSDSVDGAPQISPEEEAAALRDEVAELRDKLLRAIAEQENIRKRSERERDQTRKYAVAGLAGDLLTVADNLRRALESAPPDRTGLDEAVTNLIVGVEMTERDLLAAFEGNGVRRIAPMGEAFDYNLHQAMFEVEDGAQAPGTVVQLLQPGYVLGDRVLRAAMVGVAKAVPEEASEAEASETSASEGSETSEAAAADPSSPKEPGAADQ